MLKGGSHMFNSLKTAKLLAIREMQIKISVRCNYPPIRMTEIATAPNAEEDLENMQSSHIACGKTVWKVIFLIYISCGLLFSILDLPLECHSEST